MSSNLFRLSYQNFFFCRGETVKRLASFVNYLALGHLELCRVIISQTEIELCQSSFKGNNVTNRDELSLAELLNHFKVMLAAVEMRSLEEFGVTSQAHPHPILTTEFRISAPPGGTICPESTSFALMLSHRKETLVEQSMLNNKDTSRAPIENVITLACNEKRRLKVVVFVLVSALASTAECLVAGTASSSPIQSVEIVTTQRSVVLSLCNFLLDHDGESRGSCDFQYFVNILEYLDELITAYEGLSVKGEDCVVVSHSSIGTLTILWYFTKHLVSCKSYNRYFLENVSDDALQKSPSSALFVAKVLAVFHLPPSDDTNSHGEMPPHNLFCKECFIQNDTVTDSLRVILHSDRPGVLSPYACAFEAFLFASCAKVNILSQILGKKPLQNRPGQLSLVQAVCSQPKGVAELLLEDIRQQVNNGGAETEVTKKGESALRFQVPFFSFLRDLLERPVHQHIRPFVCFYLYGPVDPENRRALFRRRHGGRGAGVALPLSLEDHMLIIDYLLADTFPSFFRPSTTSKNLGGELSPEEAHVLFVWVSQFYVLIRLSTIFQKVLPVAGRDNSELLGIAENVLLHLLETDGDTIGALGVAEELLPEPLCGKKRQQLMLSLSQFISQIFGVIGRTDTASSKSMIYYHRSPQFDINLSQQVVFFRAISLLYGIRSYIDSVADSQDPNLLVDWEELAVSFRDSAYTYSQSNVRTGGPATKPSENFSSMAEIVIEIVLGMATERVLLPELSRKRETGYKDESRAFEVYCSIISTLELHLMNCVSPQILTALRGIIFRAKLLLHSSLAQESFFISPSISNGNSSQGSTSSLLSAAFSDSPLDILKYKIVVERDNEGAQAVLSNLFVVPSGISSQSDRVESGTVLLFVFMASQLDVLRRGGMSLSEFRDLIDDVNDELLSAQIPSLLHLKNDGGPNELSPSLLSRSDLWLSAPKESGAVVEELLESTISDNVISENERDVLKQLREISLQSLPTSASCLSNLCSFALHPVASSMMTDIFMSSLQRLKRISSSLTTTVEDFKSAIQQLSTTVLNEISSAINIPERMSVDQAVKIFWKPVSPSYRTHPQSHDYLTLVSEHLLQMSHLICTNSNSTNAASALSVQELLSSLHSMIFDRAKKGTLTESHIRNTSVAPVDILSIVLSEYIAIERLSESKCTTLSIDEEINVLQAIELLTKNSQMGDAFVVMLTFIISRRILELLLGWESHPRMEFNSPSVNTIFQERGVVFCRALSLLYLQRGNHRANEEFIFDSPFILRMKASLELQLEVFNLTHDAEDQYQIFIKLFKASLNSESDSTGFMLRQKLIRAVGPYFSFLCIERLRNESIDSDKDIIVSEAICGLLELAQPVSYAKLVSPFYFVMNRSNFTDAMLGPLLGLLSTVQDRSTYLIPTTREKGYLIAKLISAASLQTQLHCLHGLKATLLGGVKCDIENSVLLASTNTRIFVVNRCLEFHKRLSAAVLNSPQSATEHALSKYLSVEESSTCSFVPFADFTPERAKDFTNVLSSLAGGCASLAPHYNCDDFEGIDMMLRAQMATLNPDVPQSQKSLELVSEMMVLFILMVPAAICSTESPFWALRRKTFESICKIGAILEMRLICHFKVPNLVKQKATTTLLGKDKGTKNLVSRREMRLLEHINAVATREFACKDKNDAIQVVICDETKGSTTDCAAEITCITHELVGMITTSEVLPLESQYRVIEYVMSSQILSVLFLGQSRWTKILQGLEMMMTLLKREKREQELLSIVDKASRKVSLVQGGSVGEESDKESDCDEGEDATIESVYGRSYTSVPLILLENLLMCQRMADIAAILPLIQRDREKECDALLLQYARYAVNIDRYDDLPDDEFPNGKSSSQKEQPDPPFCPPKLKQFIPASVTPQQLQEIRSNFSYSNTPNMPLFKQIVRLCSDKEVAMSSILRFAEGLFESLGEYDNNTSKVILIDTAEHVLMSLQPPSNKQSRLLQMFQISRHLVLCGWRDHPQQDIFNSKSETMRLINELLDNNHTKAAFSIAEVCGVDISGVQTLWIDRVMQLLDLGLYAQASDGMQHLNDENRKDVINYIKNVVETTPLTPGFRVISSNSKPEVKNVSEMEIHDHLDYKKKGIALMLRRYGSHIDVLDFYTRIGDYGSAIGIALYLHKESKSKTIEVFLDPILQNDALPALRSAIQEKDQSLSGFWPLINFICEYLEKGERLEEVLRWQIWMHDYARAGNTAIKLSRSEREFEQKVGYLKKAQELLINAKFQPFGKVCKEMRDHIEVPPLANNMSPQTVSISLLHCRLQEELVRKLAECNEDINQLSIYGDQLEVGNCCEKLFSFGKPPLTAIAGSIVSTFILDPVRIAGHAAMSLLSAKKYDGLEGLIDTMCHTISSSPEKRNSALLGIFMACYADHQVTRKVQKIAEGILPLIGPEGGRKVIALLRLERYEEALSNAIKNDSYSSVKCVYDTVEGIHPKTDEIEGVINKSREYLRDNRPI